MYSNYDELGLVCSNCEKCNMSALKFDELVCIGRGNIESKLLILAPLPIERDNNSGYPLVGLTGVMLERMLDSVGIDRQDYYLTTAQKCNSHNDNEFDKDMLENCLPYLEEQIRLVNPSVILCLGADSLKALTRHKAKITQDRGKWYRYKNRMILLIYHPNYLLSHHSIEQGKPKYMTWLDLIKLKNVLDGNVLPELTDIKEKKPNKQPQNKPLLPTYDNSPF